MAQGFSFDFKGIKESRKRATERAKRSVNLMPAFRRLGPIAVRDVKQHFRETKGPTRTWPRKKTRLVAGGARKRGYYVNGRFREKPKTGIGLTGILSRVTSFRATARDMTLFAVRKGALRFHEGFSGTQRVPAHTRTVRKVFGRTVSPPTRANVRAHSKTVRQPPRPFMWLSQKARGTIRKGVLLFIVSGSTTGRRTA